MSDPDEAPTLTLAQLGRAISAKLRRRLIQGQIKSGADVRALRCFLAMTQAQFAQSLGVSVLTLRHWELNREVPTGPALRLLAIAARHPRLFKNTPSLPN